MDWLRRNFVTLAVLAAIALSFVVGRWEVRQDEKRALANDVASCMRENSRSAIGAAWQHEIAEFADNAAERRDVVPLEQLVRGSEAYLAVARYIDDPTEAVKVHTVLLENGTVARVLTQKASNLIQEGCERAYGAEPGTAGALPIPVVGPIKPSEVEEISAPRK